MSLTPRLDKKWGFAKGAMGDDSKPGKCFNCGGTKFCWTPERGWICIRCYPPSKGVFNILKTEVLAGKTEPQQS